MFFGRTTSCGIASLWSIPVVAALGMLAGCTINPDLPVPPGIYSGEIALTVTSVFTPTGGEPNILEERLQEPFEVAIGLQSIPETQDGPVKVGDEFEQTVEASRFTFTITEIRVDDDKVVIAFDITLTPADPGGEPAEPPPAPIGTGSDNYRLEGSDGIRLSRQWHLSNTTEQGVRELMVVGSGDLIRE